MKRTKTYQLALAGMLIAVGIIIPTFSPIKIIIEPASFTRASHVPVFLAMFISPAMGVAVSLGTTLGFFLGGFPLTVVLRALTHVIFALAGALYLKKNDYQLIDSVKKSLPFYINGSMPQANYDKGFFVSIFLLVGVGSVIHSMFDFALSVWLYRPIQTVYSRMGQKLHA